MIFNAPGDRANSSTASSRIRGASRLRRSVVLLLLSQSAPAAGLVTRGPYLQRTGDATLVVVWDTSTPVSDQFNYWRPGEPAASVSDPAAVTTHVALLGDLIPGSEYEYQIVEAGVPLTDPASFLSPRAPQDDSLSFGVVGDTAGGTVPAIIAGSLVTAGVDLVLHAGDVVYPSGRAEDFDSDFFVPFGPLLRHTPVLPILGDHDIRTDDGAPFFDAFYLPENGITLQPRYYSFRQGIAEFYCLDVESSEFGEDSDQYRWLQEKLQASTAVWKFVTVFEPPFSSENSNVVERLILCPLFERYGVDLVFSGHEHLYERSRPLRLFGPSGQFVTYVVEGGGGASLDAYDPEGFSAFVQAVHGCVTVQIRGATLTLEAHTLDGTVIDTFALAKGATPVIQSNSPVTLLPISRLPIDTKRRP